MPVPTAPTQVAGRGWDSPELAPPNKKTVPEGLWIRCPECSAILFRRSVENNLWVCPECQYHFRIDAETGRKKYAIIQAEDELSAAGMVIGAGWAGARAFTATSGPGLSLSHDRPLPAPVRR